MAALYSSRVCCARTPRPAPCFTFDPLPEPRARPWPRPRPRRRAPRVLYPPVVKRYYPPEERCFAKRLLVVLLAILFFQIYSADEDLPMGPSEVGGALYDPPIHEDPLAPASAVPWSCRPHDPTVDISQFLACNPAAF